MLLLFCDFIASQPYDMTNNPLADRRVIDNVNDDDNDDF